MTEQKKRTVAVAYDCRYYLGDRPCKWHKQDGVICECEYYSRTTGSLLIIKLDAIGDVLRTTCLLPVIQKAWPHLRVTWITRSEAAPLLEVNPYITEVIPYGPDALVHLSARKFARVINLDAGSLSSAMAGLAKAKDKVGYVLHQNGYVTATNAAAEEWLRMGVFDDLKRANKRTYQDVMCSIIGLSGEGMKYVLELRQEEKERAAARLTALGLDLKKNIIGIHTGGGGRWRLKQWSEEKFVALMPELFKALGSDVQIVIFGGPLEREQNKRIMEKVKGAVFDAGCDNDVRHFAALTNCCSVMLSGDSLAMHVALAMGRRAVVLFGPTSNTEIELFDLGEKVIPDMDCLSCYKKECDFEPNCMDSIPVDVVKKAVLRQLNTAQPSAANKTVTSFGFRV